MQFKLGCVPNKTFADMMQNIFIILNTCRSRR